MLATETKQQVPDYTPPTNPGLKIPLVVPGKSDGRVIEGDFPLDQIVIDQFPSGTQVISCDRYGASAWTVTARIVTTLPNGESQLYFLKCAEDDQGKRMLEGEFYSMCELYKTSPTFVPKPHSWGKLNVASPDTYYFLCDFVEMSDSKPDPHQFATDVIRMHQASESPTGQFGFHFNTCQGNLPQQTGWNPSWAGYYSQLVKGAMALNKERNGDWKDLEPRIDRLLSHVVPQLLGPLEADGRTVKPTLIHGDLWDGNIGLSLENGGTYAFDSCAHYAHNEMEIAIWRTRSCKVLSNKAYLNAYLSRMGISEPIHQFEDRNRLYTCYLALHASACHNGSYFREDCYDHLTYLVDKYAPMEE